MQRRPGGDVLGGAELGADGGFGVDEPPAPLVGVVGVGCGG
ncbi:hypothetical protein MI170_32125 [Mycolicibacterium goodii]|nr:hypothetical protein [Mycolicibacterium goodii]UVI51798.1 hypothetical protein MI170_32125 [Mycolicibacterium goodii]